jgi:hypothetical protein
MRSDGSGHWLARRAPLIVMAIAVLFAMPAWAAPSRSAAAAPSRPAAAARCPAKAVPPPISDRLSALYGVAVWNGCDAWAVGQATANPLNPRSWAVALHWNGRSWRRYRVPAPKAATSSELTAVEFLSATRAWAPGAALERHDLDEGQGPGSGRSQVKQHPDRVAAGPGGTAWAVGSYSSRAVGAENRGPAQPERSLLIAGYSSWSGLIRYLVPVACWA